MSGYLTKYKIFTRIVVLAVLCLFMVNNIAWANPDIFRSDSGIQKLQPALLSWATPDRAFLEFSIQSYIESFHMPLKDLELHLYPNIKGKRVDIHFDRKIRIGKEWLVPCFVENKKFNVLINPEDNSLRIPSDDIAGSLNTQDSSHIDAQVERMVISISSLGHNDGLFDAMEPLSIFATSLQMIKEFTLLGAESRAFMDLHMSGLSIALRFKDLSNTLSHALKRKGTLSFDEAVGFLTELVEIYDRLSFIRRDLLEKKRIYPEAKDPDTQDDYLKIAVETLDEAMTLVDNRIAFATGEMRKAQVSLDEMVRELAEEDQFKDYLRIEGEPEKVNVLGDKLSLRSTLINILNNALHFARDRRGDSAEIRISLDREDKWARVTISDNGPGIDEKMLREDPETGRPVLFRLRATARDGGTGIGLAEAWVTVTECKGSITAENAEAGGAKFTIELPLSDDTRGVPGDKSKKRTGSGPADNIYQFKVPGTEITGPNWFKTGESPEVLSEGGAIHCNYLLAYDPVKHIGAITHTNLSNLHELSYDKAVRAVALGVKDMSNVLSSLGANKARLQFIIIRRDLKKSGLAQKLSLDNHRLLAGALYRMKLPFKTAVTEGSSVMLDLRDGTVKDPLRKVVARFSPLSRVHELDNLLQEVGKLFAMALLPLAFLVFLVSAPVIIFTSKGPVFYRQRRIGERGKPITVWKFRTMTTEKDPAQRKVTFYGKLVRLPGFDELPQLLSIINGDMQWFGPRPYSPDEIDQAYIDDVLHGIKPGLFSLRALKVHGEGWQRNTDIPKKETDLEYLRQKSWIYDIEILLKTIVFVHINGFAKRIISLLGRNKKGILMSLCVFSLPALGAIAASGVPAAVSASAGSSGFFHGFTPVFVTVALLYLTGGIFKMVSGAGPIGGSMPLPDQDIIRPIIGQKVRELLDSDPFFRARAERILATSAAHIAKRIKAVKRLSADMQQYLLDISPSIIASSVAAIPLAEFMQSIKDNRFLIEQEVKKYFDQPHERIQRIRPAQKSDTVEFGRREPEPGYGEILKRDPESRNRGVETKPESPDMAGADKDTSLRSGVTDGDTTNPLLIKHIRKGIAVEVDEKSQTVQNIRLDGTISRAPPVEEKFRDNGLFAKIRKAKDISLLSQILAGKENFRNLTNIEKLHLVHIIQNVSLSILIGKVIIGKKSVKRGSRHITRSVITHVRTGFSENRHGLQPTIWLGEVLLERISVQQLAQLLLEEAQHILKPPRKIGGEWVNLHGSISVAPDPSVVIEHDEDLLDSIDISPISEQERIFPQRGVTEQPVSFKPEPADMARYGDNGAIRKGRLGKIDYGGLSHREEELSTENMEEAAWQLYLEAGDIPSLKDVAARLGISTSELKQRTRKLDHVRKELGLRGTYFPQSDQRRLFQNPEGRYLEDLASSRHFQEVFELYENKDRRHHVWKQSMTFKNAFFRAKIIKFIEEIARNVKKPGRGDVPLEETLKRWFARYDDPMLQKHGKNKARKIMGVIAEKGFDFVLKNFPGQAEYILSLLQAKDFGQSTRIRLAYGLKPHIIGNHRLMVVGAFPELKMDVRDFVLWWQDIRGNMEDEQMGIKNVRHKFKKYRPEFFYRWTLARDGKLNEKEKQLLRQEFASTEWEGDIEWMRLAGGLHDEAAPYFEGSVAVMISKSFSCPGFELLPEDVSYQTVSSDEEKVMDEVIRFVWHHFKRRHPEIYDLWEASKTEPVSLEEAIKVRECIEALTDRDFREWGGPLKRLKDGRIQTPTKRAMDVFIEAFSTPNIPLERRDFELSWGSKEESVANLRFKLSRYDPDLYLEWERIAFKGGTIDEQEALRKKLRKIGKTRLSRWQAGSAGNSNLCPWFKGSLPCVVAESFRTEKFDLDELDIYNSWKTEQDGIDSVRHKFKRIFPGLYRDYLRLEEDPANEAFRQDLRARFGNLKFKDVREKGLKHATNRAAAPYFEGSFSNMIRKSFPVLFAGHDNKPEAPDMASEELSIDDTDRILCELIEYMKRHGANSDENVRSLMVELGLSPRENAVCAAINKTTTEKGHYRQALLAERKAAQLSEICLSSEAVPRRVFGEIGRCAYELAVNCIRNGFGGIILIETEEQDDDVLFRITARDLGPGIEDLERTRKMSFDEGYMYKGRGHGFRTITGESSPFRKGRVVYNTNGKSWVLDASTGKFRMTGGSRISKGVQAKLEITKNELSGESVIKGDPPASLFSLDKDYAIEKAPRIETGLFLAGPLAVISGLVISGRIGFWGASYLIGAFSAVFIGSHFVNYLRAPPEVKEKGVLYRMSWAFKAPLAVGLMHFVTGLLFSVFVPISGPLCQNPLLATGLFTVFIYIMYSINADVHQYLNEMAFEEEGYSPASIGDDRNGKESIDENDVPDLQKSIKPEGAFKLDVKEEMLDILFSALEEMGPANSPARKLFLAFSAYYRRFGSYPSHKELEYIADLPRRRSGVRVFAVFKALKHHNLPRIKLVKKTYAEESAFGSKWDLEQEEKALLDGHDGGYADILSKNYLPRLRKNLAGKKNIGPVALQLPSEDTAISSEEEKRKNSLLPKEQRKSREHLQKPEAPDMAKDETARPHMSLEDACSFFREFAGIVYKRDLVYSNEFAKELVKHGIDDVMIIGAGLSSLPFLLALMGKNVTFVNLDPVMVDAMELFVTDLNSDLADAGIEGSVEIKVITGEIGSVGLSEHGLEENSVDLLTFVDLIGAGPIGEPKQWLAKAAQLLRRRGYLLIDERDEWLTEALSEQFPEHELLSDGKYFNGDYEGMNSMNRFYRVVNPSAQITEEDPAPGQTCSLSEHNPAKPGRTGLTKETASAGNTMPLTQEEWFRMVRKEVKPYRDSSIFIDEKHKAELERELFRERLQRARELKQLIKSIFMPLGAYTGKLNAEVISTVFANGQEQFYRKLAEYKITDLQYQLTRASDITTEEDYLKGVRTPGAEFCDTVSSVAAEALKDVLSPSRVKQIYGMWYSPEKDEWRDHFWLRIDEVDLCFTFEQFDERFWGTPMISRAPDTFKDMRLFVVEEEPARLHKKSPAEHVASRTGRLMQAIKQADTDQRLNAMVKLTMELMDRNLLEFGQINYQIKYVLSESQSSGTSGDTFPYRGRFEYVLDRLGACGSETLVRPEQRKGTRGYMPLVMGPEFDRMDGLLLAEPDFSWGEGQNRINARIRYDGYRTIQIFPAENTKKSFPELEMLDMPADSILVPAEGVFGHILIDVIRTSNENILWIEEVQPSIGIRKIKPASARQKFRDWNTAAIEHIAKLAMKAGFKTVYGSTETELRQKYGDLLNQGNVRENYNRPFRENWEKIDFALGRRQTRLWRKKADTPLDAVINRISHAHDNKQMNAIVPEVVDNLAEGEYTIREFTVALNKVLRNPVEFAKWIYVLARMGLTVEGEPAVPASPDERLYIALKEGKEFRTLEQLILKNMRYEWGEASDKVGALILYDAEEKCLQVFPDRETLVSNPELEKLEEEATDAYVPDKGLFGVVRIQELRDGEEAALWIDEVQPSIGLRRIKPAGKREKFRDWNRFAVDHLINLARMAGFKVLYASTEEEIRARYGNDKSLSQGNLKGNYRRPFRDDWHKTEKTLGRRKASLWHLKLDASDPDEARKQRFLKNRARLLQDADHQYYSFSRKDALVEFLSLEGLPIGHEPNSLGFFIEHFFDVLKNETKQAYIAKTSRGGHQHLHISFQVDPGTGRDCDEFVEYFYVDNTFIAHAVSPIEKENGKTSVKMLMGIDDPTFKGKGHMQVFFEMRQSLFCQLYQPEEFKVPVEQITSWDAFFFYVRRGYLPEDAVARKKVVDEFLVPWLLDRKFRLEEPIQVFGRDFLDKCGSFFSFSLVDNSAGKAGLPKRFNSGRRGSGKVRYKDLRFVQKYDGVAFGHDSKKYDARKCEDFQPYRALKYMEKTGRDAHIVRETLAVAMGFFRETALKSLQADDDNQTAIMDLYDAFWNDVRKHEGLLVRVAENLPWDSALYETGGVSVLVLNRAFFEDAALGYYFPPKGLENKYISIWLLCERLNHELSHSDKYKDSIEEELKEEAKCVHRDYFFLKYIFLSPMNGELKNRVELYVKNLKDRYGSNGYFRFLYSLIPMNEREVRAAIWEYLVRGCDNQNYGIKAFPSGIGRPDGQMSPGDVEETRKDKDSELHQDERTLVASPLRQLNDPQQLSLGLVEMLLSVTFNRKLVLGFDSTIASCHSADPVSIFSSLEKLKQDPRYARILKNLIIVRAPGEELGDLLGEYADKEDTEVFMFALETSRQELCELESRLRAVYIDEEDFPYSSYYPLAEIVAMALSQLFEDPIVENAPLKSLSSGLDLSRINIESVTRQGKTLIFKLLPDAEPCDTADLLKRYAGIKRFLKAA
ncbi:MAG: hypothetical protein GF409_01640 [Candidatus Omnitrophica bacterium]|nr:hypothetical protein [Candidatus Omnitrophota bacterium]